MLVRLERDASSGAEGWAMSEEYNVFISWSGERSKWVAEALRDWLPTIIQSAKPWMSEADIDKGARGFEEIDRRLAGMRLGIVCLTPENLNSPWMLYEAGALSKSIGEKTRLWTYLLCGLEPKHIVPPLSMFQGTVANQADTRRLLGAINRAVSENPLLDVTVDHQFQKWWPDLKEKLEGIPNVREAAEPKRPLDDMVAEILEIARAGASDRDALREQIGQLLEASDRSAFVADAGLSRIAANRAAVLGGLTGNAALMKGLTQAGEPARAQKFVQLRRARAARAAELAEDSDPAGRGSESEEGPKG